MSTYNTAWKNGEKNFITLAKKGYEHQMSATYSRCNHLRISGDSVWRNKYLHRIRLCSPESSFWILLDPIPNWNQLKILKSCGRSRHSSSMCMPCPMHDKTNESSWNIGGKNEYLGYTNLLTEWEKFTRQSHIRMITSTNFQ